MKQGISFWVQRDDDSGEWVGLTSYSRYLSHIAATPEAALLGIIELIVDSLRDAEV